MHLSIILRLSPDLLQYRFLIIRIIKWWRGTRLTGLPILLPELAGSLTVPFPAERLILSTVYPYPVQLFLYYSLNCFVHWQEPLMTFYYFHQKTSKSWEPPGEFHWSSFYHVYFVGFIQSDSNICQGGQRVA